MAANQTANVQVMIYRGATISGTVSFDDGTPAAGVSDAGLDPAAKLRRGADDGQHAAAAALPDFAQTDDRGQFRLTGLADGTYIVFAAPRSIFPIYYGNTIERSQRKEARRACRR